ncbi:MAG: zinc ribbon domain-containing protein [Fibrobacter sp.]|nr:zinc ribbon domain-containing protein [Fibrobacter sp.]
MKNTKKRCTYCGEEISGNAKACPHCGSDEQTGWSDKTYLDGIDIPEIDDETYKDILHSEFGAEKKIDKKNLIYVIAALILLILFFIQIISW